MSVRRSVRRKYRSWWVGEMCRTRPDNEFKLVVDLNFMGPPSFVYGEIELIYSDATREYVPHGDSFRPRKKDVEVFTFEVRK